MRLTALADAFRNQLNDPKMKEVPFEDRLGMLVDIEYTSRKNNRLRRLIRKSEFDQPDQHHGYQLYIRQEAEQVFAAKTCNL